MRQHWTTFLALAMVGLPIAAIILHLFLPTDGTWPHLWQTVLPGYIANTVILALAVGAGSLVIGCATAWLVVMCQFPGRRIAEWALVLPLAIPAYVLAYAYTDFLQVSGPVQTLIRDWTGLAAREYWFPQIRSLGGAVLILILALYPYVYLAARASFLQQSECVLEAGRTLGCSPLQGFYRIALPMARPALAAGTALAMMEAMADFGAVSYFGVQTFTTGIYRTWFSLGDRVAAAQLSAVLLGFVFLLLIIEAQSRRKAKYFETGRHTRPLSRIWLAGARGWLATTFCLLPVIAGFALPVANLTALAIGLDEPLLTARYLDFAWNSVTLAAIAATLAVLLSVGIAYTLRGRPSPMVRAAGQLAGLGYAIPGTIIAVGVLIPLARLDNAVDAFMESQFGLSTGLLLTGSIVALIFAYLVRFLAVSLQTSRAGLERITPSMDAAAASLGVAGWRAIIRVHAPLLRGTLLTAILMVFVEVMKELPATLIMRPFNFDTLAVQAYNLAADERLAEAAIPALSIVAVSLLPVILLSRMIARSRPGSGGLGRPMTRPDMVAVRLIRRLGRAID